MELGKAVPEMRIAVDCRDVQVCYYHGDFGECADCYAGCYPKGASSAASKGPEEVSVLVCVCCDMGALMHVKRVSWLDM